MRTWMLIGALMVSACEDPPPAPGAEIVNAGELYAQGVRDEMSGIVMRFVAHVREGRTADAYAMTASGYQQMVDEPTFSASIARAPYLTGIQSVTGIGSSQRGGSMRVTGLARSTSDVQFQMDLTREGDEWKILGLTIGGLPALPTPN